MTTALSQEVALAHQIGSLFNGSVKTLKESKFFNFLTETPLYP